MRRTWPQRLLIGVNVVVVLATAAGLAFGAIVYLRVRSIPSVDIGSNDDVTLPTTAPRLPEGPQNFLIVGSDSRSGLDETSFGTVDGQRADVIVVARVDLAAGTASMLSLPRDLFVDIYDASGNDVGRDRINTAFAGGPSQLVTTIRRTFGIPIDHYLEINFAGFRDVVDAIGGVTVFLAGPVRDRDDLGRNRSGLDVDAVGCVQLDGAQTLAYVRSRHFEQQLGGRWRSDPTGDIGRIRRQHDLARRVASQAIGRDLLNPTRLLAVVDAARDNLVIDDGLSPASLVELGQQLNGIDPAAIGQHSLAVHDDTTPAGAAVLLLDDSPDNDAVLDVYRGVGSTPTTLVAPGASEPPVSTTTSTTAAPAPSC